MISMISGFVLQLLGEYHDGKCLGDQIHEGVVGHPMLALAERVTCRQVAWEELEGWSSARRGRCGRPPAAYASAERIPPTQMMSG